MFLKALYACFHGSIDFIKIRSRCIPKPLVVCFDHKLGWKNVAQTCTINANFWNNMPWSETRNFIRSGYKETQQPSVEFIFRKNHEIERVLREILYKSKNLSPSDHNRKNANNLAIKPSASHHFRPMCLNCITQYKVETTMWNKANLFSWHPCGKNVFWNFERHPVSREKPKEVILLLLFIQYRNVSNAFRRTVFFFDV